MMTELVDSDVIRAGAELINAETGKWLTPQDISAGVAILIHGFTSHGRYMSRLADYLQGYGFCAALFNYDSYLGIDRAARDLQTRLSGLDDPIKRHGLVLIAHSMGGWLPGILSGTWLAPWNRACAGWS